MKSTRWRFPAVPNGFVHGIILFLGIFTALNLLGELLIGRFDANYWWIIFPGISNALRLVLLTLFALASVFLVLLPIRGTLFQQIIPAFFVLLAAIAVWNGALFYILLARAEIHSKVPFPLSWITAIFLLVVAGATFRGYDSHFKRSIKGIAMGFGSALCLFPVLQMLTFGRTDYSRPADAAVVPGARVYADGHLSDALEDRVRTACELYSKGLVRKLIFSGGPADGPIDEPEAMKTFAIQFGVREKDIILDHAGLNTKATVENTSRILQKEGFTSVLCVSHFYHLPRLKLAFERANIRAYTVPARESYILGKLPLFMAREVAALGKYYFDPLLN